MTRFNPSKTKSEAEGLVRQWIDAALWRQEARLAETDGFAFLQLDEIKNMDLQDAVELDGLMRFGERMFAGEQKAKIARALGPGAPGFDAFEGIVNAVGDAIGVPVDRETADGRFYARMILRGHATLLDEMRETIAGIPKQVQGSVEKPILPTFPFFTYWDEFVATKKSDRKWKRDTAGGAEASPRLFKALIGDLPFSQIDGSVVGRFRLEYLKLPFDHFHSKLWNKLTTKQVLAAVQKLDDGAKAKLRLTSTTSANKHVINFIEYWDHLALHAKIPRGLDNPFRGHFTAKPRGRAARDEHPMWPTELDKPFFTSPVYAGCKSIFRRGIPGDEVHRDALFWVPLFGRTMGVREDEICGRLVGDIEWVDTEIGRLPYLKIRNSKTSSSSRDVPLHDLILQLGFLEHRYYDRQPTEPLFPELIPQGAEPRRSGAFSGRFTEYRKKTKTYRPGVDFRSYRGAVETALRNFPDVNAGWVDELIGHDSPIRRSEGARYTKSIFMMNLKRTIDKVTIDVDLSKLYYMGRQCICAPGSAVNIASYTTLALREMRKKAARRRLSS
ncbi:MAG: hypothetical protein NT113_25310 [Hyphomicrobiales bacterium]|nr:hypothetical protein [Hyphomicrobiales bacterium]